MASRSLLAVYVGSVNQASHTQAVTLAAGTNRKIVVVGALENATTFSSATFNAASMTAVAGATITNTTATDIKAATFYYDVPDALAAGSYNVVVTLAASTPDMSFYVEQLDGVATGGPEATGETEWTTTSTNATITLSCTDGAVFVGAAITSSGAQTWVISGSVTETTESNETNYTTVGYAAVVSGSGNKTATATVSTGSTGNKALVGVSFAAIPPGPTITTQPTAQTSRLNGEVGGAGVTFSFACAAAITSVLWEIETAVGSGSYTTISNGGVYSITTNAGAGTGSLTVTPTSTADSGKRIRVTPTDANGSTVSTAVALTIRTGPTLSATSGVTDGSGQAAPTLSSDEAGTLVITALTAGGVTKYVTNAFTAP